MEKYRAKLEKEVLIGRISCIVIVVLIVVLGLLGAEVKGFLSIHGLMAGFMGVVIGQNKEKKEALKNEELLKKRYIQENDERNLLISAKAGSMGMFIVLLGLFAAMTVSAYIDQVIFHTLLVAVIFVILVMIVTNIYYDKKM